MPSATVPNQYPTIGATFNQYPSNNPTLHWLNNVQLRFSVNLQETCLFICGFSIHATFSLIQRSYLLVNAKHKWRASCKLIHATLI